MIQREAARRHDDSLADATGAGFAGVSHEPTRAVSNVSTWRTRSAFPVLNRSRASAIIPPHALVAGAAPENPESASLRPSRPPYVACLIVGLGGLFAGVTGPLLSTFVPILVRDALGRPARPDRVVMAIDNVLLLLLVPLAGVASDRARARGGQSVPILIAGLVLAAVGMAVFPASAGWASAG